MFCWITAGREIENYLPAEAISAAYRGVTGIDAQLTGLGRFQKIDPAIHKTYRTGWKASWAYEEDKVGWAKRMVPAPA